MDFSKQIAKYQAKYKSKTKKSRINSQHDHAQNKPGQKHSHDHLKSRPATMTYSPVASGSKTFFGRSLLSDKAHGFLALLVCYVAFTGLQSLFYRFDYIIETVIQGDFSLMFFISNVFIVLGLIGAWGTMFKKKWGVLMMVAYFVGSPLMSIMFGFGMALQAKTVVVFVVFLSLIKKSWKIFE